MKTDALHRRLRYSGPQPSGARIALTARDISIFETLHQHGPLPTTYLFEATKRAGEGSNGFQHRLTKLFNGTAHDAGYLVRPPQQFASFEARYQPLIYDLGRRAEAALAERGLLARYAPRRTDPFLHRVMGACVSVSLALGCSAVRLEYITKEQVLQNPKCPDTTKQSANPLAIPISQIAGRSALIPDDVFGIRYADQLYRFFAVEIDRTTESIERTSTRQTAFARKIAAYQEIMACRAYRAHWGVPNFQVLIVTTTAARRDSILDCLRKQAAPADRFLVRAIGHFGASWNVPHVPLTGLITDSWQSISGEARISTPAPIAKG